MIDSNSVFRIENIKNLDGTEKTNEKALARIGRTGFFEPTLMPTEGLPMCFFYLLDQDGESISGKMLRTTRVTSVEIFEFDCPEDIPDYIIVKTENSIYTLERINEYEKVQQPSVPV